MATTTTTYDLRDEIRAQLANDLTNPHDIARELAAAMPDDVLRNLAAELIANEVRSVIRSLRTRAHHPPPGSRSARWEQVKGLRTRLDDLWAIGTDWKRLRECTRDDVEWLAGDYGRRAEANAGWRDAFIAIGKEMKRRRVKTVGALPDSWVDEVLP